MDATLENTLRAALLNRLAQADESDTAFARRCGLSPSYLNYLKQGKSTIGSLSLDKAIRLFPDLTHCIEGMASGAPQGANVAIDHSAIGNNNTIADDCSGLRARISSAILDLDIPAEATRLVLRTIRDTK